MLSFTKLFIKKNVEVEKTTNVCKWFASLAKRQTKIWQIKNILIQLQFIIFIHDEDYHDMHGIEYPLN